ncbi:uncharacterized protein [Dysidea avara]|uniref:uncharacterized protein n=1 Tax=Dysidea avara TaxID=196820 RepID=UPI003328D83A
MDEEEQQRDALWWIKEKQALEQQLAEKDKEITTVKSRNYDLLKQVEELTQKLQKSAGLSKKPQRKAKQKHKTDKTTTGGSGTGKLSTESATVSSSKISIAEDPEQFYKEIAERFPKIALSAVLNAEKRFVEADSNGDGTIDADELEKMLDQSGLLFSKKQAQEILATIDMDDTGTLDFMECLEVIDKITQNRATNLPQVLTTSTEVRSHLCTIQ